MSGPVELSGPEPEETEKTDGLPTRVPSSGHEGLQDSGSAGRSPAEETEPEPEESAREES